jgi:hypothetical protein
VPPVVVFESVVEKPTQTLATPDMVSGRAFTVATFIVVHPTNE